MKQKVTPLLLPVFILLFCGFYAFLTARLPSRAIKGIKTFGPSFMPWVLVTATSFLSLLELISCIKNLSPKERINETNARARDEMFRNTGVVILFILFIALMPVFGFLPVAICYLAIFILIIGGWNWPTIIITPIVTGFFLHYLFHKVLNVPLP